MKDKRIQGIMVSEMVNGGTEMMIGANRDPTFGPIVVCSLMNLLMFRLVVLVVPSSKSSRMFPSTCVLLLLSRTWISLRA